MNETAAVLHLNSEPASKLVNRFLAIQDNHIRAFQHDDLATMLGDLQDDEE